MAAIEIKNLTFSYPGTNEAAVDNVSFLLEKGEFCLVCGKSGSGKSTLLRLLKKEIAPFGSLGGEICINADGVGFVNQNVEGNIITDTVSGELAFPLQNSSREKAEIDLRVAEAACFFNLGGYFNEKTKNLSGGIKQLLALAAAMAESPSLLVLDEPCSQLDPASCELFVNAVKKLNKEQGVTVIISEHKSGELLEFADKVLLLDKGRAEFFGSAEGFADFTVNNNHPMQAVLPPYTRLLEGHPLSFSEAQAQQAYIRKKAVHSCKKSPSAVSAKSLCFAYKKGLPDVLFNLNYEAAQGKINAIVGANGSGKTTFLKCIANIYKPYGGRIRLSGRAAYMPQRVKVLFLEDRVSLEIKDENLLKQFDLYKLRERNPLDLSGGEEQRLALAKLLSCEADILVLDEPTKSIDPAFKPELAEILRTLKENGKTIIFATHDLEFAADYADNAAFLFNGSIAASAPCDKFFADLKIYTTRLAKLTGGRVVALNNAEVVL